MKTPRIHYAFLAAIGALTLAPPVFANHPAGDPNLGTPIHGEAAERTDRTITLDANDKWVNVTGGETVKFIVNGKSFSWHFDTFSLAPVFDLDQIAPADMLSGRSIKVYVAKDPLFSN